MDKPRPPQHIQQPSPLRAVDVGVAVTAGVRLRNPVAGTKVLESFTDEFEIGSKKITLETGKIARFANGAVILAMEETKVLSTVASAKGDAVRDFLPLTIMKSRNGAAATLGLINDIFV